MSYGQEKHKYSTYFLLGVATLLIIGVIASGLDSSEADELCAVDGSVMYRTNGTWGCGVVAATITAHANLYFHNDTNPLAVTFPTADEYYNVTGLEEYNTENMITDNDSIITVSHAGQYYIQVAASFQGGGSETYEMELFVNEIENEKGCEFHRKMGTGGDVGSASLTCNVALEVNDEIRVKMENTDVTPTDADLMNINFHAHRIGGFTNASSGGNDSRVDNIAGFSCGGTDKVSSFNSDGTPVCTTDGGGAAAGSNDTLMISHECIGTCDTFINTIEKV